MRTIGSAVILRMQTFWKVRKRCILFAFGPYRFVSKKLLQNYLKDLTVRCNARHKSFETFNDDKKNYTGFKSFLKTISSVLILLFEVLYLIGFGSVKCSGGEFPSCFQFQARDVVVKKDVVYLATPYWGIRKYEKKTGKWFSCGKDSTDHTLRTNALVPDVKDSNLIWVSLDNSVGDKDRWGLARYYIRTNRLDTTLLFFCENDTSFRNLPWEEQPEHWYEKTRRTLFIVNDPMDERDLLLFLRDEIYKFDKKTKKAKAIQFSPKALGHGITSIELDKTDSTILWIGTRLGGLVRYDLGRKEFNFYVNKERLNANDIFGLATSIGDPSGVWLATKSGLYRFDKQGLVFEKIGRELEGTKNTGRYYWWRKPEGPTAFATHPQKSSSIYIGWSDTLWTFDLRKRVFSDPICLYESVKKIIPDPYDESRLWFLARKDGLDAEYLGLGEVDLNKNISRIIFPFNALPDYYGGEFKVLGKGQVEIGEGGAFCNSNTMEFTVYSNSQRRPKLLLDMELFGREGLKINDTLVPWADSTDSRVHVLLSDTLFEKGLYYFHSDNQGNLWYYDEKNLFEIPRERDAVRLLDARKLISPRLTQIVTDDTYTWFGTLNGLSRLNKTTGETDSFTKKEGLIANAVNQMFLDTLTNDVWFIRNLEKPFKGGLSVYHRKENKIKPIGFTPLKNKIVTKIEADQRFTYLLTRRPYYNQSTVVAYPDTIGNIFAMQDRATGSWIKYDKKTMGGCLPEDFKLMDNRCVLWGKDSSYKTIFVGVIDDQGKMISRASYSSKKFIHIASFVENEIWIEVDNNEERSFVVLKIPTLKERKIEYPKEMWFSEHRGDFYGYVNSVVFDGNAYWLNTDAIYKPDSQRPWRKIPSVSCPGGNHGDEFEF